LLGLGHHGKRALVHRQRLGRSATLDALQARSSQNPNLEVELYDPGNQACCNKIEIKRIRLRGGVPGEKVHIEYKNEDCGTGQAGVKELGVVFFKSTAWIPRRSGREG
jgi:hypothetical protein